MHLLNILLYFLYNTSVICFTYSILGSTHSRRKLILTTGIINFSVFALTFIPGNRGYENYFILFYLLLYWFELKTIYKSSSEISLFATLLLGVNFFGTRLFFMGVLSYLDNIPIVEYISYPNHMLFISVLNFAISIPFILIITRIISKEYFDTMCTDKKNMRLLIALLGLLYLYQFMVVPNIYIWTEELTLNLLIGEIGLFTVLTFAISVGVSYIFAKSKLHVHELDSINMAIFESRSSLQKLHTIADTDEFTGCYNRDAFEREFSNMIGIDDNYCLIYIDIDGLKIANDVYGHHEGDFYIKAVVDIIDTIFSEGIKGRLGGDEFGVIYLVDDYYSAMSKIIRCSEQVKQIKNVFNKEYLTSISYGVVTSDEMIGLQADEIFKLADDRMYEFKKARKRERKTIKI